ncbi:MAG: hypothetical protein HQK53_02435 [Oligoflexia bacterium]|nr:hypothetical protein [Oligoflexia bacterium]
MQEKFNRISSFSAKISTKIFVKVFTICAINILIVSPVFAKKDERRYESVVPKKLNNNKRALSIQQALSSKRAKHPTLIEPIDFPEDTSEISDEDDYKNAADMPEETVLRSSINQVNPLNPHHPTSILLGIDQGKSIVNSLFTSQKIVSTTSARKEYKSTMYQRDVDTMFFQLAHPNPEVAAEQPSVNIDLTLRDAPSLYAKNYTITFYGKSAHFQNEGVITKIKLRARFYAEVKNGVTLRSKKELKDFHRSAITKNRGWLELKILNPSPQEALAVHKYRILLKDDDILKIFGIQQVRNELSLYQLQQTVQEVSANALQNPINDPTTVNAMMAVIQEIAIKDIDFLHPQMGISYQRSAYQMDERVAVESSAPKVYNHQITVDQGVTSHLPQIKTSHGHLQLRDYVVDPQGTYLSAYQTGVVAVEYKDPHSFQLDEMVEETAVQSTFRQKLLSPMREQIVPGFEVNRGKAFHFGKINSDNGDIEEE